MRRIAPVLFVLAACDAHPGSLSISDSPDPAVATLTDELSAMYDRIEALEAVSASTTHTSVIATRSAADCAAATDGSVWIPVERAADGMAPIVIERWSCPAADGVPATSGALVLTTWTDTDHGAGFERRSCRAGCDAIYVRLD